MPLASVAGAAPKLALPMQSGTTVRITPWV
jgi:hypothetical protein